MKSPCNGKNSYGSTTSTSPLIGYTSSVLYCPVYATSYLAILFIQMLVVIIIDNLC